MTAATLVRVAGTSIRKNKMRTLLTMLGIIIGVAAVIMMVAIGSGAQRQIQERIGNLGTNMLVITPGAAQQGGVSQGAQTFNRLTVDDADLLRASSTLLSAVTPVIATRSQVVGGSGNWRTFIYGVHPDYVTIRNWTMGSGVFFDAADVRAMRKVAVIGNTVAQSLFPDEDPVGQQIRIRDVPFKIVGVFAAKGQTAEGTDQDDMIIVPYTTAQTRLAGHQFIPQILVATYSSSELVEGMDEVRAIMRDAHKLGPNEADDFTVKSQEQLAETAQQTTHVMTLLLSAIASISLLVGGIGIMNIMLVSVTERTREIGLRMALGARGADILTQFLVESVVLCVIGGAIGVLVGVGGSIVLGKITGWVTAISPETVAVALVFSATVGVFFGFYPARRAASLDPIEALRYE